MDQFRRPNTVRVLAFDITDRASFEWIKLRYNQLKEAFSEFESFLCVVCGTKADLASQRTVPKSEAEKYANSIGTSYFETSALLDTNVTELFTWIVEKRYPVTSNRKCIVM